MEYITDIATKKMMGQKKQVFEIPDRFIAKALAWACRNELFSYFAPSNFNCPYGTFPHMLAAGHQDYTQACCGNAFAQLDEFSEKHHEQWLIGYLGYDLKNEVEALHSQHPPLCPAPDMQFYVPRHLLLFDQYQVTIYSEKPGAVFREIQATVPSARQAQEIAPLKANMGKEAYLDKLHAIKNDIVNGEYYELNLCLAYHGLYEVEPVQIFLQLQALSPMPFAVLHGGFGQYIISASPERFLKKQGKKVISQPMKGTAARGQNPEEDQKHLDGLKNSEKERAENMMIVDLVRNDLTHCAVPGTITVEEIFGAYTFPGVHQLISTISAQVDPDYGVVDLLKSCFPMGSMTGAPKIRAMQAIDTYEANARGRFSGAFGYISPERDFDFNVLIRSLFYNEQSKKTALYAGGAITYDSIPGNEYAECQLKLAALMKALKSVR